MSGDHLNVVFFVASIGAAGVLGAISTGGMRARILWAVALLGLILTIAAMQADEASPFIKAVRSVWITAPFIGAAMALLVSGDRKPLERPFRATPPVLNPALTVEHLSKIASDCTELEAKRRLAAHSNERARLKGQVHEVKDTIYPAGVKVEVAFSNDTRRERTMRFRPNQADQLAVIKRGDWIEFTGRVEHAQHYGWELVECEFVGLVEAPKAARSRSRPAVKRV